MPHISKILRFCTPNRKKNHRTTHPDQNPSSHKSHILITRSFTVISSSTTHPCTQAYSSSKLFERVDTPTPTAPRNLATIFENVEITTSTPPSTDFRIPRRPLNPKYQTLLPRTLSPFPSQTSFSSGGDDRQPLDTFLPIWGANFQQDEEVDVVSGLEVEGDGKVWEYVYKGVCGCTWPLRRVKVDKRDAQDGVEKDEGREKEEEEVVVVTSEVQEDYRVWIQGLGVDHTRDEKGIGEDVDGVEFIGLDEHGVKCEVHARDRESIHAPHVDGDMSISRVDVGDTDAAPRRFRMRVRRSDAEDAVAQVRFKVRMRVSEGGGACVEGRKDRVGVVRIAKL
jgi:hypothetical protein